MAIFLVFLNEVEAYLAMAATSQHYPGSFAMPKDTLFIIWIGANDLWSVTPATATSQITESVSNIQNGLSQLIDAGASKFMVITLPNLGKAPKFNKNETTAAAGTQISLGFNQALEQVIFGIDTTYPAITIKRVDAFNMLSEILGDAEALGFDDITNSKLNSSTGEIADGNYFFWDSVHPTTFAHKLIAKKVAEAINCENCKGNTTPILENDLTLKVPSAKFGDNSYGFTLVPHRNATEDSFFWTLDMNSIQVK